MHHGLELSIVLIVCLTLTIGAAMRLACGFLRVPYTVAMLLAGILTGAGMHVLQWRGWDSRWLEMLEHGADISPNLILFIFVPALVFESAFAVEVYAFRKNVGAMLLLAGPALIVSILMIGGLMRYGTAGTWQWAWMPALLFGALISATDPVAVVALLREVGAPKRLSLLIEGESLLNDGTAIVAFTVLLGMITGTFDQGLVALLFNLVWVTGGGIIVGLTLGIVASAWLGRTFNNPLVEITLTIVLAYLSMLIAEAAFHVSGVMAVVAAGLWMSGPGRTCISPEVTHFLHRFWEMLSYLANTLIFFLVGLVIATEFGQVTWPVLGMILLAYIGVVTSRFVIVFGTLPLMNRVTQPVSPPAATVMAWGGLRGAVSMALALVVSQNESLPASLRSEILLVTAGVVLLSILINGTTISGLLRILGLDRPPPSDRLAQLTSAISVLEDVGRRIDQAAVSRDLRTVNWQEVKSDLRQQQERLRDDIAATKEELDAASFDEKDRGYWRQVLSIERGAYWAAFSQGMLSRRAARILNHDVDLQTDRLERGEHPSDQDRHRKLRLWRPITSRTSDIASNRRIGPLQFELLSLHYDLWRGESLAAARVLEAAKEMQEIDEQVRERILNLYHSVRHRCKQRIEDLRVNLPEVTQAIETRLARRIQLNFQHARYQELLEAGVLDLESATAAMTAVQQRMKRLRHGARTVELPPMADLCRNTPLFAALDSDAIAILSDLMIEKVLTPGDVLFTQGDKGESMYIIARGAIEVSQQGQQGSKVLDVLGGGDILGEMALLSGAPRSATARAITTVTLGEITRERFDQLMQTQPQLRTEIRKTYARRLFDDYLRSDPRLKKLSHEQKRRWFAAGHADYLQREQSVIGRQEGYLFLASGRLHAAEESFESPQLIPLKNYDELFASEISWVVELPPSWVECISEST